MTNISSMFSHCELVETLGDISKWNTTNAIDMSWMLYCYNELEALSDISKSDTDNITDMYDSMFSNF